MKKTICPVPICSCFHGRCQGALQAATLPQVLSALQASWLCVPEKVQSAYFPLHWDTEPGTALQPARQVPEMGLPAHAAAGADSFPETFCFRAPLKVFAMTCRVPSHIYICGLRCTTFSFFFFFWQIISTQLIITLNVVVVIFTISLTIHPGSPRWSHKEGFCLTLQITNLRRGWVLLQLHIAHTSVPLQNTIHVT